MLKTYNPPRNDVHIMANTLSKYFEVRWKFVEKKLAIPDFGLVPIKSSVPLKDVTYAICEKEGSFIN